MNDIQIEQDTAIVWAELLADFRRRLELPELKGTITLTESPEQIWVRTMRQPLCELTLIKDRIRIGYAYVKRPTIFHESEPQIGMIEARVGDGDLPTLIVDDLPGFASTPGLCGWFMEALMERKELPEFEGSVT